MTTASDVLKMLRTHYVPENRPAGCLFMPEIGAPDGRRRADLLVAPTSISGQLDATLVGHEVKVTRADVMAELRDPTKADPWLKYCTYWYLVVSDPALIDGLTIPETWGIMAPPSGRRRVSMTILRPAPKLEPTGNLAPAISRIAAYIVNRVETEVGEVKRRADYLERDLQRTRAENEQLRLSQEFGGRTSPHAQRLHAILSEVQKQARDNKIEGLWWYGEVNDEDVIAALTNLTLLRRISDTTSRQLESVIRDAKDIVEPFQKLANQVQEVRTQLPTFERSATQ